MAKGKQSVRKNTNNLPFHLEGKVRMGFVYARNIITHPHSFPQDGRTNNYATFVAKESILMFVRTQEICLPILRGRSGWGSCMSGIE